MNVTITDMVVGIVCGIAIIVSCGSLGIMLWAIVKELNSKN